MAEGDDQFIANLERLGPNQVRTLMQSGSLAGPSEPVIRWLAIKDQEAERLSSAAQALQMRTALSAKKAAWIAATAAIIAAILAVISIVVALK